MSDIIYFGCIVFVVLAVLGGMVGAHKEVVAQDSVKKIADKLDELDIIKNNKPLEQHESQIQMDKMIVLEEKIKDLEAIIARLENLEGKKIAEKENKADGGNKL